jgi:hypothetical protein
MGTINTMEMVAKECSESPAPFVYTSILLNIKAIHGLDAVGTSNLTFQTMLSEVVSSGALGGNDVV